MIPEEFFCVYGHGLGAGSLHVEGVKLENGVLADDFLGFEEFLETFRTAVNDIREFLFVERGLLPLLFKHGLSILRYYKNDVIILVQDLNYIL
jgi:hypothetical protein